jgi:hypothetical protein
MVPSQPGQKSLRDAISMEKKLGVVLHTYHPSNGKWNIGGLLFSLAGAKK